MLKIRKFPEFFVNSVKIFKNRCSKADNQPFSNLKKTAKAVFLGS